MIFGQEASESAQKVVWSIPLSCAKK